MNELAVMQGLTEQQKFVFISQMTNQRKDPTTALLLTLFLGGLGAHRFYMNQIGLGVIYLIFSWTFLPAFVALIECFFIRTRVEDYNDAKANEIARQIMHAFPAQH